MKTTLKWNGKMKFAADFSPHTVMMDAKTPIGEDTAATPKQLALGAVCGCTAIDVVALMRKYRQEMQSFVLEADAEAVETYPQVFKSIKLDYKIHGPIDAAKAIEAVTLSLTKYCSVSAMMSKACPIYFDIYVNDEKVNSGQAKFEF